MMPWLFNQRETNQSICQSPQPSLKLIPPCTILTFVSSRAASTWLVPTALAISSLQRVRGPLHLLVKLNPNLGNWTSSRLDHLLSLLHAVSPKKRISYFLSADPVTDSSIWMPSKTCSMCHAFYCSHSFQGSNCSIASDPDSDEQLVEMKWTTFLNNQTRHCIAGARVAYTCGFFCLQSVCTVL